MRKLVLAFATAAAFTTPAMAQQIPPAIAENVRQCVAFGYKQSCCIKSYSATPAGAMNNKLRHQQIAACSGVPPRG